MVSLLMMLLLPSLLLPSLLMTICKKRCLECYTSSSSGSSGGSSSRVRLRHQLLSQRQRLSSELQASAAPSLHWFQVSINNGAALADLVAIRLPPCSTLAELSSWLI
ncbi:hypothetical protein AWZ03_008893 [Drosophila navojoa]|uniref:Secreted protein n=1 Tax=Drosophila navojoa TaxID=7232 RepID=A0A484B7J3_DRONA|nr:hypothetical protein AWZ03_008893 [Drosophila navojoa]